MNRRLTVALTLALAACNSGSSTVDSRVDLPHGSDLPTGHGDQPGKVDQARVDKHQPAEGIAPDKKALDQKVTLDKKAQDQKVSPDLVPDPCAGITCGLLNDCCDCYATNGPPPGICKMMCKQNMCDALGIKPQVTYCIAGYCVVTAGATSCTADTDCQRIDNCCDCLALPNAASAPDCKKLCLISTCVSRGLATAKAHCVLGECRLQK
jgi:hypothetical protein